MFKLFFVNDDSKKRGIQAYTGKTYYKASEMDIDHIVPLSHAHKTGGANWSHKKKREFVNDPMNLLTVEDNINKAKGDQAPDEFSGAQC